MNDEADLSEDAEHLFLRSGSGSGKSAAYFVGGLLGIGAAVVGMSVAILGDVDQITLHMMTTLPTIMGVGALAAGWSIAHMPDQVSLGPEGLIVEAKRGRQELAWDDVGWAKVDATAMGQQRQLIIYGTDGKKALAISSAFDDFDRLVDLVKDRVAAKQDGTAEQVQWKKARKTAWMLLGFGTFMACAAGGITWDTHSRERGKRLLAEVGREGEAKILRRFLAPNGVTPRLEYKVTGTNGRTSTRNAQLQRPVWDALADSETVPVIYVAEEPDISRLVVGEAEKGDITDTPLGGYGLAAAGGAMSLFMLVAGLLAWYGWDIDLDSKTGKVSIKRFGEGT
ncbi:MAG: hypothetical protein CMJ48_08705 [Planctomycetaceae bacterium]|nr:hypothetical protein [Planctomycetaceae bacterium]